VSRPLSFADLGISPPLVAALASQGIVRPFPIQALTIADGIAGRDVCGKAKTGSGKTLAFGLPLLERCAPARPRHPTALVLAPTRELALQVAAVLEPLGRALGRRVVAVYGGADLERQAKALRRGAEVVVATPGRLIDLTERGEVVLDSIGILVVDEADRMADMGFLPQVEWLLRRLPSERQTLLFSATLDSAVDLLVRRHLRDPVSHEVAAAQVTVEEMLHRFLKVHQLDKAKVAAAIVRHADKALVFVGTKRGADRLVDDLRREGVRAAAIHGDLRQKAREEALDAFSEGTLPVLVATDVAARGLDIEGVDVVVHYDPPEDHKAYLHRSGRTARAGEAGLAVTLVLWDQELAIERLKRRLGLSEPTVEVFSNDPRLADLASWQPGPAEGMTSDGALARLAAVIGPARPARAGSPRARSAVSGRGAPRRGARR
jgi:superfamily II DNA/RNA helicase